MIDDLLSASSYYEASSTNPWRTLCLSVVRQVHEYYAEFCAVNEASSRPTVPETLELALPRPPAAAKTSLRTSSQHDRKVDTHGQLNRMVGAHKLLGILVDELKSRTLPGTHLSGKSTDRSSVNTNINRSFNFWTWRHNFSEMI